MSRNKLIAKYAALDTPDLGERIAEVLNHHISNAGIEELPVLSVIGRWTGRISLVNGGWHDDFELNAPALACLSIDRNARVFPNMDKINGIVEDWRNYLHTQRRRMTSISELMTSHSRMNNIWRMMPMISGRRHIWRKWIRL